MKKYLNKFSLSLVLTGLMIVSCQDDQDVAPIISTEDYPVASITEVTETSVNEQGNPTVTITIETDKPLKEAVNFAARQIGGSADENDFNVSSTVLQPFSTKTEIVVEILEDDVPESSETLTIEVYPNSLANQYLLNPTSQLNPVNITIGNLETTDFQVKLEWDGTYTDSSGDHSLCDLDLDLEIYTEDFATVVGSSYGSCPESVRLQVGDLPDGNYWLVPEFWSASGVPAGIDVPAKITFSKVGVWDEVVDLSGIWNTTVGGNEQGNPDWALVRFVLNISGDVYTVSDDGNVIIQGKTKDLRNFILGKGRR